MAQPIAARYVVTSTGHRDTEQLAVAVVDSIFTANEAIITTTAGQLTQDWRGLVLWALALREKPPWTQECYDVAPAMDRSDRLTRRMFLERAAIGVLTTAAAARELDAQAVPNSSGTEPPQLKAPPRACDCHMHIYDAPRFPLAPVGRVAPTSAAVPQYRLLQKRLGTTRVIVVTPRNYATDNRATVDAIAQFAPNARGVAVVHPTVSDVELKKLHAAGIRGIRFSLGDPKTAAVTVDMIEPLAKRIAALGWHVQINWTSDDIAAADAIWKRLPTPIVFDHIGQLPASGGVAHPAYAVMRRLLDAGRAWVKLSVTYTNSRVGPPGYADVVEVGQALVKAVPERLVWGSNWPHPNEPKSPDDARLFDLMAQWAPDEAVRRRIFVDNPARLYDFAAV